MRDAKTESEGRPTDARRHSGRTPKARVHAGKAAAAPDRRNERARASRLTARLRAAIIAFLARDGESPRESATPGAPLFANAPGARAEHPMAAA